MYCELSRTGFLGIETLLEGEDNIIIESGTENTLEVGKSVTISHGFSIGFEGVFKEAFGAGVSYECEYQILQKEMKSSRFKKKMFLP